jgi:ABC-type proline/glycine betaine transport system substrate-binding protein
MATTLTTRIANTIKQASGKGTIVFNDKLKSGERSLKVWGWSDEQYTLAKAILEQLGCTVKVVEVGPCPGYRNRTKPQTRLHITEI